jgi:dihydrodipicolinate synthase/N-acetylneuraminate lyase
MSYPLPSLETLRALRNGMVLPAHPLALTAERKLDERRQKALTRYYAAAGAGGIAVGVHTTQFAIRDPGVGLLQPALEIAADTIREIEERTGNRLTLVAGACGPTPQAAKEAALARGLGYDAGLLSLSALKDEPDERLIEHCRAVAREIPLFGFYLQPSVGGRALSRNFWRRFAEIPNVVAIKVAPFNRYQTLDVVRAVAEAGRTEEIALYTGNDDHILLDLLSEYRFKTEGEERRVPIVGGLLGHWAVWTKRAVEQWSLARRLRTDGADVPADVLALANAITDANAALFDPPHGFAGCIAGLHEVLRRQGLMEGIWCLDPSEGLSPGQSEEIDRVYALYPELNDDAFVAEHLEEWLR